VFTHEIIGKRTTCKSSADVILKIIKWRRRTTGEKRKLERKMKNKMC
jgi:hypothetical protein